MKTSAMTSGQKRRGGAATGVLRLAFIFALVLVLTTGGLLAGGVENVDHSARSMGMGGSMVAAGDDPTVIHLNPAALAFLTGTNFSLGSTVMLPELSFTGAAPGSLETKMQPQVIFPPDLYLSHTFGESWGMGIAIHEPYSTRTEWTPDWIGSRLDTKSDIRVLMVTPSLGMRVRKNLAVGLGLNIVFPKVLYEKRIPLAHGNFGAPIPDGYATYEESGDVNVGVQAGLVWKPSSSVTLGAACRSSIGLDMDNGQVSFRNIPDSLASQFVQQRYVSSFVLPTQIQAGLCWQPLDWIVVSSDIEYSWWSQIKSIVVTYPNSRWLAQTIQAGWRNTVNSRSGLELLFGDVALRAGYRIEDSPIPDRTFLPGIPDAAGTGYTLGFGYRVAEGLVLDFAYMFLRYGDRDVTNSLFAYDGNGDLLNGTYVSKTTAIALNVLYTWK